MAPFSTGVYIIVFLLLCSYNDPFVNGLTQMPCHCAWGRPCCPITGSCSYGCENVTDFVFPLTRRWSGPGCQTGNVALGRNATFGPTEDKDKTALSTSSATDGTFICDKEYLPIPDLCVGSPVLNSKNYWVEIDLKQLHVIQNVAILTLDGAARCERCITYLSDCRSPCVEGLSNTLLSFLVADTKKGPEARQSTRCDYIKGYDDTSPDYTTPCNARLRHTPQRYFRMERHKVIKFKQLAIVGYPYIDCGRWRYGPGCLLNCDLHCMEQCDVITGECKCRAGTVFDSATKTCQEHDLTEPLKRMTSSSNSEKASFLSSDYKQGYCFWAQGDNNVVQTIPLQGFFPVYKVNVTYIDDSPRADTIIVTVHSTNTTRHPALVAQCGKIGSKKHGEITCHGGPQYGTHIRLVSSSNTLGLCVSAYTPKTMIPSIRYIDYQPSLYTHQGDAAPSIKSTTDNYAALFTWKRIENGGHVHKWEYEALDTKAVRLMIWRQTGKHNYTQVGHHDYSPDKIGKQVITLPHGEVLQAQSGDLIGFMWMLGAKVRMVMNDGGVIRIRDYTQADPVTSLTNAQEGRKGELVPEVTVHVTVVSVYPPIKWIILRDRSVKSLNMDEFTQHHTGSNEKACMQQCLEDSCNALVLKNSVCHIRPGNKKSPKTGQQVNLADWWIDTVNTTQMTGLKGDSEGELFAYFKAKKHVRPKISINHVDDKILLEVGFNTGISCILEKLDGSTITKGDIEGVDVVWYDATRGFPLEEVTPNLSGAEKQHNVVVPLNKYFGPEDDGMRLQCRVLLPGAGVWMSDEVTLYMVTGAKLWADSDLDVEPVRAEDNENWEYSSTFYHQGYVILTVINMVTSGTLLGVYIRARSKYKPVGDSSS